MDTKVLKMTNIMDNTISNEEEVIEEETSDVVEEVSEVPTVDDYNRLIKENKTLKAQKEHFKKKSQAIPAKTDTPSSSEFLSREEAVLIAQGVDIDDLDQLKAIQKGFGYKSFKEAMDSQLFKAYSKEKKAEKERESASLGASGGSTGSRPAVTSDMSEEDHKAAWAKAYQK